MTDQLISFDTAKLAKEKGFPQVFYDGVHIFDQLDVLYTDGVVRNYYYNTEIENRVCVIPTQSLLQKWLREERNMIVIPGYSKEFGYIWRIIYKQEGGFFKTYEEALERGLYQALLLI